MATLKPNPYIKLSFSTLSLIYSFLLIGLALLMAGGGDGWISTFWASTLVIISLPIASLALVHRKTKKGKKYSLFALLMALIADILLVSFTYFEGFEYAFTPFQYDINEEIGSLIFSWYLLWFIWQLFVFIVFIINLKSIAK